MTKAKSLFSPNISPEIPSKACESTGQWEETERSEAAESALVRGYHYHMLRAEELREFLRHVGITFPGFGD
jgi:hypothetical protein